MLKKRIIPVQLLLDGRLVKSTAFGNWRDVGDPVKSSQVYNSQNADELIFLNISRDGGDIHPMAALLDSVSRVSFMPLAVGGGIRSFGDVDFLIRNGADKVVINTAAHDVPGLIARVAETFGSQAVIVAIDDDTAAARFEALPHVESVIRQGAHVTIRGQGDVVTEVVHCLAEHRLRVTDFRTEVPTLEDVFLKLTGHAIRS